MGLFIKHLIQLIIAPHTGWEDIKKTDRQTNVWLTKGFYPLLGLTAASCFMALFYHTETTLGECIQNALAIYISYFTSYFIAGLVFSWLLDRIATLPDSSEQTRAEAISRFNIVSLFTLSLMALLTLIENLLPFDITVTKFIFIYVLFILYRGADFAGVPNEKAGIYTLSGCLCLFLPPFAIYSWLSMFFK